MGSGRWWAWNPDTGRSTTDAGGLTTDAGTLRMQDFLTRGTSYSGRALIRCHSRKTRPSCRAAQTYALWQLLAQLVRVKRLFFDFGGLQTQNLTRPPYKIRILVHRLTYKAWKTTLPPCCTQPEVKKQTISAALRHSAKSRYPQITDTGSLLTLLPQSQFLL